MAKKSGSLFDEPEEKPTKKSGATKGKAKKPSSKPKPSTNAKAAAKKKPKPVAAKKKPAVAKKQPGKKPAIKEPKTAKVNLGSVDEPPFEFEAPRELEKPKQQSSWVGGFDQAVGFSREYIENTPIREQVFYVGQENDIRRVSDAYEFFREKAASSGSRGYATLLIRLAQRYAVLYMRRLNTKVRAGDFPDLPSYKTLETNRVD